MTMLSEINTQRPANPDEMYTHLETLRPIYLKSKARIDGEDEEWNARKEFLLSKIMTLLKGFNGDDSATKAVLIIGQSQALAAELDQPRLNVLQYESLRQQYNAATS